MSDGVIFESIGGIYNFDGEKKNLLLLFLRGLIMVEVLSQGGRRVLFRGRVPLCPTRGLGIEKKGAQGVMGPRFCRRSLQNWCYFFAYISGVIKAEVSVISLALRLN